MTEGMIPDEMKEIVEDFISETHESLDNLEPTFVELEKDPGNLELINSVFRVVHSLKGAADFLGFPKVVKIAHKSESLFNRLRKEEMVLTPEIMDVVFEAVDVLKALIHEIETGETADVDVEGTADRLVALLSGEKSEKNDPPVPPAPETLTPESAPPQVDVSTVEDPPPAETAPVSTGENESEEAAPPSSEPEPEPVQQQVTTPPAHKEFHESGVEQTIRVEVERLDSVMNLVGELVLARNRLFKINHDLEQSYGEDTRIQDLIDTTLQLSLLTTDLQLAVLKTRMQPLKKVFSKIPRMIRDLARKMMKEVDLQIVGEETEVDKSVIEAIGDPLVHLIRNAVDHGIEIPDFRVPLGKPEKGMIRVSASYEGDHILIDIEDDGKGMDPEQLRQTAVEKGILDAAEAERLSVKECFNLIFAPGFSTAARITSTSGRGVGMDVVKTNIAKLNGSVNVESQLGVGSKFRIRLPLTVAIIQSLMVGVEEEIYAIPLSSVIETLRVTPQEIQTVDDKEVITLRDEILPLVHLSERVGLPPTALEQHEQMYVVVTSVAEKKVGLMVTKLYGQEEIVIKSLGNYLKGHPEFSGATLTGDGKVIMILDIVGLQKQPVLA